MKKTLFSIILVTLVIFIVPLIMYGSLAPILGLEIPESKSPELFLLGTLVSKIGTAIAFVFIYKVAVTILSKNIKFYVIAWLAMFIFGEISQPLAGVYSWKEAFVGILSELIYIPTSAAIVYKMIKS